MRKHGATEIEDRVQSGSERRTWFLAEIFTVSNWAAMFYKRNVKPTFAARGAAL